MGQEEIEHTIICNWIKSNYPNVIFNTDLSGIKLPIGQAKKIKRLRSSKAFPDLVVYEPRCGYSALFIELKRTGEKIKNKNGEFKTDHLKEQAKMIEELNKRGFLATFAIGFKEALEIIGNYLKNNKNEI